MIRFVLFVKVWLCLFAGAAQAHSPYLSDFYEFSGPTHGDVRLMLICGDGVFGPDPVRAFLVDREGHSLAMSRLAYSMSIHCSGTEGLGACLVYDGERGAVFELYPAGFGKGLPIEENGRALEYPEYIDEDPFGFTEQAAGGWEILRFELAKILRNPIGFLIAALWWAVIWWPVVYCFAALWRNGGIIGPIHWPKAALVFAMGIVSAGMLYVTALIWSLGEQAF